MSTSRNAILFKCLYRSLLKQSRLIDESPINQCFLISKPRKIYIHEYGCPVNVRLNNSDFEIVERILNEHCGGEYFAPSLPDQESKSLENIIKQCFRFGIPTKYDPLKVLDETVDGDNKYLELAFYAKKRLSYSTNVIAKIGSIPCVEPTAIKSELLSLPTQSLTPLNINENSSIVRGALLISHPLSCLGQRDLYRKVIYIIEASSDRIVGITLNAAYSVFDCSVSVSKKRRNSSKYEYEYCFRGWNGEYNYIGGPVNDENCPFCIIHENGVFYDKFKQSSTVIISNNDIKTYWTWVNADNYQSIYHSLNEITRIIQYKRDCEKPEISGKIHEIKEIDAQIISESNDNISENEFYSSIMNDNDNNFKFIQKYSYWSPSQLNVEIKNNVWFSAQLNDKMEERELVNLKCPKDYKNQYNKILWETYIAALGNEYKHLALFPELNNDQTKEFYAAMNEFHTCWVPDVDTQILSDDENEEEDTNTLW